MAFAESIEASQDSTRERKWSQKQIHGIGQYEVIPFKTENTFRAAVNGKFHV